MRVKAGPGVMEPDGDTTHGQMVNPTMEEVTNSLLFDLDLFHCMYVFLNFKVTNTILPSISSPHPVVGMMKIRVQRRGSSASMQVQ